MQTLFELEDYLKTDKVENPGDGLTTVVALDTNAVETKISVQQKFSQLLQIRHSIKALT